MGWGLGDNIYTGRVAVRGNAGAIPGVAIRGAEIVVHGNMGSRAGKDADVVSKVALKTEIDGLNGANPLKLSMPVMIAPMSYGARTASMTRRPDISSCGAATSACPSRHWAIGLPKNRREGHRS